MSSPRKSTGCKSSPEQTLEEDVARMHCLQALFPEWSNREAFYLKQIKESIEAALLDEECENSFQNFANRAEALRQQTPGKFPESYAFISLDFSNQTWEPLFAREEIVRQLKKQAGIEHIFLLVRGLRRGLFPTAQYRTKAREAAYAEATAFIEELTQRWSTRSSKIHLLYV